MVQPDAKIIAQGKWRTILEYAGIAPEILLSKQGPCPLCGGKSRFRFIDDDDEGHYYCNNRGNCGPGNGMKLLMEYCDFSFIEACDFIRKWAGVKNGEFTRPLPARDTPKVAPVDDSELRARYQKFWDQGAVITPNTAAWRYLKRRFPQLELEQVPAVLRSISMMDYFEENTPDEAARTKRKYRKVGAFPGMLALVQGVDGRICNVWRWWLTPDGMRAPVETNRKAMGRFLSSSYAIRLAEPGSRLLVTEGVETGLGCQLLRGVATWATTSESGMCKFTLPDGYEHVKRVDPFGDNDKPDVRGRQAGNEASRVLQNRMRALGLQSVAVLPIKQGTDFANIAESLGTRQVAHQSQV